jgi:ATP-grasp domain
MRVLILGARAPVCLEWARAFRATGWQVMAADSLAYPITRSSRAIHQYVRLPEPRYNTQKWIDTLKNLVVTHAIDLILPTCEEVFYLAHGLNQLTPYCRVMTSTFATMHRLHHKFQFAEMTRDWAVTSPQTWLLETPEAVAALARNSHNLVFKPAYSRFASRTLIQPNPTSLSRIQPTPAQPWVAQQFIAGREHCSFSLLIEGELKAHACYHPRYRVGRGAGIYFEPTHLPAIRTFLEQFGTETQYTGQVGFDFIEAVDGQIYVLECNPRGTSGVHLFDDQAQALVSALSDEHAQDVLLPTTSPRMVLFAMLLFAAPHHIFDLSFWRDFRNAHDVITRTGDRKPLPAQFLSLLEIIRRAMIHRRGLLAAATADIEWNGQLLESDS